MWTHFDSMSLLISNRVTVTEVTGTISEGIYGLGIVPATLTFQIEDTCATDSVQVKQVSNCKKKKQKRALIVLICVYQLTLTNHCRLKCYVLFFITQARTWNTC